MMIDESDELKAEIADLLGDQPFDFLEEEVGLRHTMDPTAEPLLAGITRDQLLLDEHEARTKRLYEQQMCELDKKDQEN